MRDLSKLRQRFLSLLKVLILLSCSGGEDLGPNTDVEGFVALYRFGESDSTEPAVNEISEASNGVYGKTVVLGLSGASLDGDTAISFSGESVESFMRVDEVSPDFPRDEFSIAMWAYLETNKKRQALLSYATSDQKNNEIMISLDETIQVYLGNQRLDTGVALPARAWRHITVSWRSSDGALQVYLDGVPQLDPVLSHQPGFLIEGGGTLLFGQEQDTLGGNFDLNQAMQGRLDEVAIYNRVVEGSVVEELAAPGVTGEICDGVDNNDNGRTDEGVAGIDILCPERSCARILEKNDSAPSGDYWVDPDGTPSGLGPMQATCDMETDGGGWMLALNYLHLGGTNPALSPRTGNLPLMRGNELGIDEGGDGTSWGHAVPAVLATFDFEETRWYAITSGHERVIHFKTQSSLARDYITSGAGSLLAGVNDPAMVTLFDDHSANLPLAATASIESQGDRAMTNFPFFGAGVHWGIDGDNDRWEVDDVLVQEGELPYRNDTFHQVWVR